MKKIFVLAALAITAAVLSAVWAAAASAAPKETGRDGSFIAYDDGTVLDTRTNLMWAAKDNGQDVIWADAKTYCENHRGGGYQDWRMPTEAELARLFDKTKTYPAEKGGKVHMTGLMHLTYVWTWAAEGSHFSFYTGNAGRVSQNYTGHSVIPVRSAK